MFLVEWHTLHVPGSVFEQLWQLSHSDDCLLSSLTCEWKCSETDRNKAGMWWRWLWQLYCAHLKVSSCHCQYRVCSSFLFSSVFCHYIWFFSVFMPLPPHPVGYQRPYVFDLSTHHVWTWACWCAVKKLLTHSLMGMRSEAFCDWLAMELFATASVCPLTLLVGQHKGHKAFTKPVPTIPVRFLL